MKKIYQGWLTWLPTTFMAGVFFFYGGFWPKDDLQMSGIEKVAQTDEVSGNFLEPISAQEILIRNVGFKVGGYLVIREEVGGNPGEIIGRSELVSGSSELIVISLSRSLVNGELLYVNYYLDNGNSLFGEDEDTYDEDMLFGKSFLQLIVKGDLKSANLEPQL